MAIRLCEARGGEIREVARRLDIPKSNVSRWFAEWRAEQKRQKRRARRARRKPNGYSVETATWNVAGERVEMIPRLTMEQRQHLSDFLGEDIDPRDADQVLADAEQRILCFARANPRPKDNEVWRQLATLHDEFYAGPETVLRTNFRRQMKVRFCAHGLEYAGYPMPASLKKKLEAEDTPPPGKSRAVQKTSPKRSAASQDFGRAVRDGVPWLKDRIFEHMQERAADAGVSIDHFVSEHDEGRELGALYSRHFSTPVDTAAKDAALSEECRRLGVSLTERKVVTR